MKVAFFDTHKFERRYFDQLNNELKTGHDIFYFETHLNVETAVLAQGYPCVCAFVNDNLRSDVLKILKDGGTQLIALRSAGFNHVDLRKAQELGLKVVRVPEYSPYAVAEHGVALLLSLNRKIHRAYNRVREGNFTLDGLIGFDLYGKTVGVLGTGRIGKVFTQIMRGFGCRVLAYDVAPDKNWADSYQVEYTDLTKIYQESDIISLHVPLREETHHLINAKAMGQMKEGVVLINTGRGALIDTRALIDNLKSGKIGGACLDVYEEEEGLFFEDFSSSVIQDDVLARLLTFPNVVMTSHQAFLTKEALTNIAAITLSNIKDFETGKPLVNEVHID